MGSVDYGGGMKRRAKGTGTVSQRRTGEWCGQADLGYTAAGRRRRVSVYAATREEVERKLAALIADPQSARSSVPARRASSGTCDKCKHRYRDTDLFRGMCGGCYPWGRTVPSGARHPQRPSDWLPFDCESCGERRWTRGHETSCLACQSKPAAAWRRRFERVVAARERGTHTDAEWLGLVAAWGGACAYCGRTDRPLTKDHVVPVARGGSELIENMAPACKRCNAAKNDLTGREYAAVRS